MSIFHVVYGLQVAATLPIPGLPLKEKSESPDVQVHLEELCAFPTTATCMEENLYESLKDVAEGQPNLRVTLFPDGKYFGLFYSDGVRFAVDRTGCEVWANWPEGYAIEDACTYLLGPVMGFVLRLRGTVSLHASAVAVDGRAIALVGLPGAGKSTTAAAFACCGSPVLSDDVVALADEGGQFFVQPGYPRVNLWPDSVRQLFGSEDVLPRVTPTWDKRYLPLGQNGHHFASSPLPLGGIYILGGRDATLTAPVIEEISGSEAFVALAANTYVNYLLDQNMRRREFDVLSLVVSEIPVRRVRMRDEPSAIFRLCEAIADDTRRFVTSVSTNETSVNG